MTREALLEEAKSTLWGTFGPGAIEAYDEHKTPLPPMIVKPLGECDTDHLIAIQKHVEGWSAAHDRLFVLMAVNLVLEDRGGII